MGEPAEELQQPDLLPMEALPDCTSVVELVRSRSFVGDVPKGTRRLNYTGKILLKELRSDPDRARAICMLLRAGVSQRLVAKRMGINTRSIANIVEAMRDRGELASVRIHVDRQLDQFAELGMERVIDGIQSGEIHPGQLLIPVLAAYDKKAQRDAGIVVGTQRTLGEVTVEQVMAARELALATRDAQSKGSGRNPLQASDAIDVDTVVDTSQGPGQAAALAAGQAPRASSPARPPGGGGGVAPAPAATGADGKGPKFRSSKEPPQP